MASPDPQKLTSASNVPKAKSALASGPATLLERVSDCLYLAAICGLPFPFGSIETSWLAAFVVILATSLLLADLKGLPSQSQRLAVAVCAILAVIITVAAVQVWSGAPLGKADPVWAELGALIEREVTVKVSAVSGAVPYALGPTFLTGLVIVRTIIYARDVNRSRQVLLCVGWTAVATAIYSIIIALAREGVLSYSKQDFQGGFTGTFVNRNTAATYFGSAAAVWIALGLSELRGRIFYSAKARRRLTVAAAAGVFCFGTVAATGSRAGFLLCAVTVMALGTLFVIVRPLARRIRGIGLAVAVTTLALLFELWGGFVGARLEGGLVDTGRLGVYRALTQMIAERPWLGWGLGAFEEVFPTYRSAEIGSWGIWEMAHSTPLEIALELGLPIAAGLAGLWILAAAKLIRDAFLTTPVWNPVATAALGVGFIGTLHSCFDFSLQVPGYAATFFVVTFTGLAQRPAKAVVHQDL